MNGFDILSALFILAGFFILAFSLNNTRHLLKLVRGSKSYLSWKIVIYLTIIFMLGYMMALVFFVSGNATMVILFTGLIFLLGAVYTYHVINIGHRTVLELTRTTISRENLENIIDSMSEMLVVVDMDADLTINANNQTTEKLLGYEKGSLIGKPLSTIIHPGDFDRDTLLQAMNNKKTTNFECKYIRADGTTISVWVGATPFKNNEGQTTGMVYLAQDLSELERSEIEVHRQKEFLESVIESLTYPFFVINLSDYSIALANSRGKAFNSGKGTFCFQVSHHRDTPCTGKDHPCPIDIIRDTGKPTVVEHIHYDKNGRPRNMEVHCFPIISDEGDINQVIEYAIDITERKEMQDALLANNLRTGILYQIADSDSAALSLDELFAKIHEHLSDIIDTTNFYIAFFDRELQQLSFPYFVDNQDTRPEPKSLGKGLTEYVIRTGKSLLVGKKEFFEMAERGDIVLIGSVPEQWMGIPLKIESSVIGVIVVQSYNVPDLYSPKDVEMLEFVSNQIADAIQHKRTEDAIQASEIKFRGLAQQLQQTNNMKELLLDVITHDLKNPAGVIDGMTDMLKEEQPENEYVKLISESSETLLKVIENATTLSRVSLGEDITRKPTDLSEMIREISGEFKILLKSTEMELKLDIPDSLVVNVNPILSEVPKNFISNAIKYAQEGKTIECVLREDKDTIRLEVRDHGTTIPEEQREVVFTRSIQLESGKKRGRGLGLAIVKRIAAAHGAEVGTKPNKPNGNIFYCYLPKKSQEVTTPLTEV